MNKILNVKNFYIIIFLLSIFSLSSAIYIEYALSINPCMLCLYQRIPYIVAIFLCLFGYLNLKKTLWIYLLTFNFLLSLILSGYHVGIENNIFPESIEVCMNSEKDKKEQANDSSDAQNINRFNSKGKRKKRK